MASPFESVIEFLKSRPYGHSLRVVLDEEPRVVIPAKCPEVGDLIIYDDDDELTVHFGNFTHAHYGPFKLSGNESEWDAATKALADDLEALFTDQLVLWGSHRSGGGTFRRGGSPGFGPPPESPMYVWSGPLDGPRVPP